jgi:hypothetical protein
VGFSADSSLIIRCTDSAVCFDFITVECLSICFHSCIVSLHFKTDCTADPSQPNTLQEINWSDIQLHFYWETFPKHGYKYFLTLTFWQFQPNMNNYFPHNEHKYPQCTTHTHQDTNHTKLCFVTIFGTVICFRNTVITHSNLTALSQLLMFTCCAQPSGYPQKWR